MEGCVCGWGFSLRVRTDLAKEERPGNGEGGTNHT